MGIQPDPRDYDDPAEFAAAWQEANPEGEQIDVHVDAEGNVDIVDPNA